MEITKKNYWSRWVGLNMRSPKCCHFETKIAHLSNRMDLQSGPQMAFQTHKGPERSVGCSLKMRKDEIREFWCCARQGHQRQSSTKSKTYSGDSNKRKTATLFLLLPATSSDIVALQSFRGLLHVRNCLRYSWKFRVSCKINKWQRQLLSNRSMNTAIN